MPATTASPDAVWAILRDVAASQKESERILNEKFQETNKQLKATGLNLKETDPLQKETDREMQQTERKLQDVLASIGRLSNNLGEFVEAMVKPDVARLFRARGLAAHELRRGVSAQRGDESIAGDLLVVN